MAIASRFRHQVVVHRHTPGETVDARGNRLDSWEPQDPIPGNVQRRASRELRGGDLRAVALSDAIAFLPIDATVGHDDYLEADGSLFELIGSARNAGGRGRHLEADLLEVLA